MTKILSAKLIPILGRKTNCPADSSAMFSALDDNGTVVASHDAGGVNFDFLRNRRSCSKSYGYQIYTNEANSEATKCMALYELWNGEYRDYIMFDNGKVFVLDQTTLTLDDITPSGVTFANSDADFYSVISFGGYMIFADMAEHTPYKWTHGDAECTKLIQSGTEYRFRYLEEFQGRIIGAYENKADGDNAGDLSIRWTDALPNWASLDFPSANQLYKPVGDDGITGIKRLGTDTCILYAENSINRIEYYSSADTPFSIVRSVAGFGSANEAGIVSVKGVHWLFCSDYGFCRYDGGSEFPSGGSAISEDIEIEISGIPRASHQLIAGTFLPITNEIVWTLSLDASGSNTHLAFYNPDNGQWRFEDKAMRYVDTWLINHELSWTELSASIGGGLTWGELVPVTSTWYSLSPQLKTLVYANTDGHVYMQKGESLEGAELNGYRIEPMLDFGEPIRQDRLICLWLDISLMTGTEISIWWRGGDSAGEIAGESWDLLGVVRADTSKPFLAVDKTAKLHQIKWGTSGANEPFDVAGITFQYIPQGYF